MSERQKQGDDRVLADLEQQFQPPRKPVYPVPVTFSMWVFSVVIVATVPLLVWLAVRAVS